MRQLKSFDHYVPHFNEEGLRHQKAMLQEVVGQLQLGKAEQVAFGITQAIVGDRAFLDAAVEDKLQRFIDTWRMAYKTVLELKLW